jgi:ribosomal protein S12 methylthiotransferase
VDQPEAADYLIVNTCGFIEPAKEESIEEILQLAAVKSANGAGKRLLVTGCLAQRYHDQLLQQIPEIDGLIGIDQLDKVVTLLDEDAVYVSPPGTCYREFATPTPRARPHAYLKIADGCDSGCSYCAIPQIRGRYRSRRLEAIEGDIERQLGAGVLEFNLIAQDVGRYGFDIGASPLALLELLENRPERFWLRPFYLHPLNLTAEIIEFLRQSQKFCNYLEVPVQHASDTILRRMNRGYDEAYLYRLFERLKLQLPGVVLRTTLMVGFPGETQADFRRLCTFVEEFSIPRGGVFVYSREEGTAAYRLGRRPASARVKERQEQIEGLLNENAERFNASQTGRTLEMLPEREQGTGGKLVGRLFSDAPQIDFTAESDGGVLGDFVTVRVADVTSKGFIVDLVRGEE